MGELAQLRQAAAETFGSPPDSIHPVHGGDLSEVFRLHWPDGTEVIAKHGPLVQREARMLNAIRTTGAPAPDVLGITDGIMFLEAVPTAPASAAAWRALGLGLRRLHDHTADSYGWPEDYAFGAVEIANQPMSDWPAFWAERRLLPTSRALPADMVRRVEALCHRLPDLLPDHPAPSLLHGDLWSGNVLFSPGNRAWLIDPASYHGDAEVDLAMLHLFGRPGSGFTDAYGALTPGAEQRRPIYQLWPALVHMRLFGGSYRGMVEGFLNALRA
ncbi:fructosamine kinase family protein [Tropicimonas sediminicola]|uniref:Fructosamine-3-kinase n=1 Tax=Tropicimonas sediminicola TaxID=1031541 RepID=A0A239KGR4_9RHOB|nr:fructosamine kinase family protein [Tropicimonas sediminicola]SNT16888.1 Fructosamine-3-kinase [Tropicimonas sediminicola]